MLSRLILVAALLTAGSASAQSDADALAAMINAYRSSPDACHEGEAQALPQLKTQATLEAVKLKPGVRVLVALQNAGFSGTKADAISISGAGNLQVAFATIRKAYCRILLNASYTDIGVSRQGGDWTVVFARAAAPLPSVAYPDWHDAGMALLDAVNQARAEGHTCGAQYFPPAQPLSWNAQLGEAALEHSNDMAAQQYFDHTGKDGSNVGERSRKAGYQWARVGENLAYGVYTPQEAVAGWLNSPGHCANIMNKDFTEFGAAYAITPQPAVGAIYWSQVFGRPKLRA
ncbi:CAP domain-containing protein [Duganella sp. FT80W]|uniref:CAP domain-containing protein n=1 Tax=Duganella guangzhouensis TaxID=2666084 RepID=A0A6I2L9L3_9BURK|nr:CAP domain-containing protein [Duganella guangzhouensis]MRW94480.1 CAP domain-containing protein [Duganella guangzhouensis]